MYSADIVGAVIRNVIGALRAQWRQKTYIEKHLIEYSKTKITNIKTKSIQ